MVDEDYAGGVRRTFIHLQYQLRRWRSQSLYVYLIVAAFLFLMLFLIINSPMVKTVAKHSPFARHLKGLHLRPPGSQSDVNAQPSKYVVPIKHIIKRLDADNPCSSLSKGGEMEQFKKFLEKDLEIHTEGKNSPDVEDFIKLLPHDTDSLHFGHNHTKHDKLTAKREGLSYKVSHLKTKNNKIILFRINERYKGNATDGGSGFRAILRGKSTELICPVKDQFNGDYMVCCPIIEDNSIVEITQTYVEFAAFSGMPLQPQVLPIFKANIRKYVPAEKRPNERIIVPGQRSIYV